MVSVSKSLQAFIDRDKTGAASDLMSKTKLITWRGMMTKLLLAVYEVEGASRGTRADSFQMTAMVLDVRGVWSWRHAHAWAV
jgi:RAT1-interacting protein